MNEALQKFLILTKANFWDWQFYFFLIISGFILAFYFLKQNSIFDIDKVFQFRWNFTGKSEVRFYLLVGTVNILLCLLMVWIIGIPVAQTHDEFGYLLAADTFLNGRFANPPPFSPPSFEYFHILVEPVYAAKYPPLQGVFLAAGILLTGYPIVGVWLSSVLASFAVYWLLRFFFSPVWSLFGTLVWILAPLNIIWLDSYWGGHAAVIGGAISSGAVFRFLNSGERKYLFVWGAGVFLLLNSRLYEGALLTGILTFLWLSVALKTKTIGRDFYLSCAIVGLVFTANLAFIGFYNYSITGSALVLPYRLHHSQYHRMPLFVFEKPGEPKPNIPPVVRKLDERWLIDFQQRYKTWASALVWTASRIPLYLFWLARSPFLIALFLAGLVLTFQKTHTDQWRESRIILLLFTIGLFLPTFTGDRFTAPIVGIFIAVATLGAKIAFQRFRFLRFWVLSLPLVVGSGFLYGLVPVKSNGEQAVINTENIGSRGELERFLKQKPGRDLIFLETADAFPADARFYVYNRADLENAEIIWAHKLTPEVNAALIEHFKDRKIWLLKNIDHRAVLVNFENSSESPDFEK